MHSSTDLLQYTELVKTLHHLHGRPSPDPNPETAKWATSVISIVVLEWWTKSQLVGVEVQPSVPDRHTVRVLNHGIPHKGSDNVVPCWNGTRAI
jgi:hypothetical protein